MFYFNYLNILVPFILCLAFNIWVWIWSRTATSPARQGIRFSASVISLGFGLFIFLPYVVTIAVSLFVFGILAVVGCVQRCRRHN